MTHEETLRFIEQVKLAERLRITNWVESNRRYIEIDAGIGIYRDSFNSESLLAFINQEKNEEVS
jgi:hypothetical protein